MKNVISHYLFAEQGNTAQRKITVLQLNQKNEVFYVNSLIT